MFSFLLFLRYMRLNMIVRYLDILKLFDIEAVISTHPYITILL